jgi:hypothetical protein
MSLVSHNVFGVSLVYSCLFVYLIYYEICVQGETGANVLVGLQVVKEDEQEFIQCADRLGYEYQDERSNEAFRLIMRYG